MHQNNLSISRQLNLALGTFFLLVTILSITSWVTATNLWSGTENLYLHPLIVRRALGKLEADTHSILHHMGLLVYETQPQVTEDLILKIADLESETNRQIAVLYTAYLGPRSDIDSTVDALTKWGSIRTETIRLLRTGQIEEAQNRVKPIGVGGIQSENVLNHIAVISTFALNKGDEFYQSAQLHYNQALIQQIILVAIILLFLIAVGFFLRRGVMTPLRELTFATAALQQGILGTRSRYISKNEYGLLSKSFNSMAETMETEIRHKNIQAQMSTVMIKNDSLQPFCEAVLLNLLQHTQAQVAAIYLLNDAKTNFELYASIGSSPVNRSSFSATDKHGEFGVVIATGQVQHLTDIPADSAITYATASGDFRAREIITIPILNGTEMVAVISLASLATFSNPSIRLVHDLVNELSARIDSILATRQVITFSQKLQSTNQELAAQAKELSVQNDEMTEQNIELEIQKQQLDEASHAKSMFLSNMSHELRTPLNSVISLTSVLNRRLRGKIPDEEYSYLDVIERNGKNLLALVNDILDLAKVSAGKEEINLSQFKLQYLVDDLVEIHAVQANDKGIVLLNNVPRDLPEIVNDAVKCRHILQNIIGNAVKFTNVGQVEVAAALVDDQIEITVRDTGIGIAKEHLGFVFDEFRQVDETPARINGGTGLGLAISLKYAQMLDGDITVQSALGHGSIFKLRLPRVLYLSDSDQIFESAHASGNFSSLAEADPYINRVKNILLIEDSEPAIIQISDILTENGYFVEAARSGKEGLDQIAMSRPDGVILDLMMPEMDGFEVLKMIRSTEESSSIPVLILTAKHITSQELSFLKSNHVTQLIQKGSIDKKALLAAVHFLVSNPNASPTSARKSVMTQTSAKPVILVVEDNEDNRITVKAILAENFDIIEASDGESGIERALQQHPDIILMDISLPVMDGIQALKTIRNQPDIQSIPVIALTARAMVGDRANFLSYGFDGYVSKPIDPKELDQVIWRCLNGD